jgi:hypothetical protein
VRYAVVVSIAFASGLATNAAAQHCQPPVPSEPRRLGLRVEMASELATYRTTRFEGEYQGLSLGLGWEHRWARLRASLSAYRLTRNGPEQSGLGDLSLDVRVPFAGTESDTFASGVGVAAMVPTGESSRDLGMGHFMLMPGAWATWRSERWFTQGQVAYGRALTSAGGTHHAGGAPHPIVNPMNASEVELAFTGAVLLFGQLRARGGIYGAVPVAAAGGASRAAAFVGLDGNLLEWLDVSFEGHLPLAGDPFLAKAIVSVGARF